MKEKSYEKRFVLRTLKVKRTRCVLLPFNISIQVGRCVLRESVLGGGGLDGYFGEQGLPAGIQECLERFHRGCVDYLSCQFVPKWDCPNGEGELATARTASLLVELEFVAA